ncbi:filamentous hemagglutinin N-terminal domain-containing protein [Paraburkholderia sp. J76]|uniref:two-partner secretion domain-containing protein n=1 Tax=Paraburkholderia sp. J76 TaxID=2805439 RepID=UPI002ABE9E2F|nr:filamentous hemagglutinin N-terminal domain-containing protein [Paraburkholderia sp. J76]
MIAPPSRAHTSALRRIPYPPARASTKRSETPSPRVRTLAAAIAVALASLCAQGGALAQDALPSGPSVVSGSAAIHESGNAMQIDTSGARTAIDWQRFSIGPDNSVTISQPGSHSVTLNRVTGPDASQIFGVLNSNGQVVLLNPNGIWFAPGAHVSTNALLASAGRISDEEARQFAGTGTLNARQQGIVRNDGTIVAAGRGSVALLGAEAENHGVVRAREGSVLLATGPQATLDFTGDGLVNIAVGPRQGAGGDFDPAVKGGVTNTGYIDVGGGVVAMSATRAADHLDSVINLGGKVAADSVTSKGGVIVLGNAAQTNVTGELSATGTEGGTIKVFGDRVTLGSTAKLDASGTQGNGGQVQVGGGFQGTGAEPAAHATTVAAGAQLAANGARDGGVIVVWSDGHTIFAGQAMAIGIERGGTVETSGRQLSVTGGARVNTQGGTRAGTWLLDPETVNIVGSGADPSVEAILNDPNALAQIAGVLNVDASTIADALKTGDVIIVATKEINVNSAIVATDVGTDANGNKHTLALLSMGDVFPAGSDLSAIGSSGEHHNTSGAVYIRAPIVLKDGNLYVQSTGDIHLIDNAQPGQNSNDAMLNRAIIDVGTGTVWLDASLSATLWQDANTAVIGDKVALSGGSVRMESPLNYAGTLAGQATNGDFAYVQSAATGTVNLGTVRSPMSATETLSGVSARDLDYVGTSHFAAASRSLNQYSNVTLSSGGEVFDVILFEAGPYVDNNGAPLGAYGEDDSSDYVVRSLTFQSSDGGTSWKLIADSNSPTLARATKNGAAAGAPADFRVDAYNGKAVVAKEIVGVDGAGNPVLSNTDAGWGVDSFGIGGAANADELQFDKNAGASQQLLLSLGEKTSSVQAEIGYLFDDAAWSGGSGQRESGSAYLFNSTSGTVTLNGKIASLDYRIDDVTRPEGTPNPAFTHRQEGASGESADVHAVDLFVDSLLNQNRFETSVDYQPVPGEQAPPGQYAIDGTLRTGDFQAARYRNTLTLGTLTVTAAPVEPPPVQPPPVTPPDEPVAPPVTPPDEGAVPPVMPPDEPAAPPVTPPAVPPPDPPAQSPTEPQPAPPAPMIDGQASTPMPLTGEAPQQSRPDTWICNAFESPSSVGTNYTASPAVARTYYVQLICKPRAYPKTPVAVTGSGSPDAWSNQLVRGSQYQIGDWDRTVIPRERNPQTREHNHPGKSGQPFGAGHAGSPRGEQP